MRRAVAVFVLLLIAGCTNVKLVRVPTTLELMRALDLHVWYLPFDEHWTVTVENAQPLGTNDAGLLHAGRESMIAIHPSDGARYAVSIDGRRATIELCESCRIEFFDPPRCNADCSAYVAGQFGERQIVITSRSVPTSAPRP